jgi:hypothetical protein
MEEIGQLTKNPARKRRFANAIVRGFMRPSRIRGEASAATLVCRASSIGASASTTGSGSLPSRSWASPLFCGRRVITYATRSNDFPVLIDEPDRDRLSPLEPDRCRRLGALGDGLTAESVREELDPAVAIGSGTGEAEILDHHQHRDDDVSVRPISTTEE